METPWVPDETTYTWAEICEELIARGLQPPTTRVRSDWTEKGLFDRCIAKPGAGQGQGSREGRWPGTQLELLTDVVAMREQLRARKMKAAIVALTNIPTRVWLEWGEDHVPIRQVRRAVGTWAKFNQERQVWDKRRKEAAACVAKKIKDQGAEPTDVAAFAEALANWSSPPQVDVPQHLLTLCNKVIDPSNAGRRLGGITKAHGLLSLFAVNNYAATHSIEDLDGDLHRHLGGPTAPFFTDSDYRQARKRWLEARYIYQHTQPLQRVAGPAEMFMPRSGEDELNDACQNVLTLLGDSRMPRP